MTDIYRVTAPYVTLKSKSDTGAEVVLGYYAGALVPESVDLQDLARHIRKGMVEKLEGDDAKAVEEQQAEAEKADAEAVVVEDKEGEAAVEQALADRAKADEAAKAAEEGAPAAPVADKAPSQSAPKADWVAWAVSQREDDVSEEDARAEAEASSKADLIAEFGN